MFRDLCATALTLLALSAGPSAATVRIGDDNGGRIGSYMETFTKLRDSGEMVMVDGDCISACTLVLAYVPPERICVTPRARFGFHRAWKPGFLGLPVENTAGTAILMREYPQPIKDWIYNQGGLSDDMKYLAGQDLRALYRLCPSNL